MSYHSGGSYPSKKPGKAENGSSSWRSQTPLDVAPLNCVPPPPNAPSASTETSSIPFGGLPAMVFFTSQPTDVEWNDTVAAAKSGVALTGTAALGKMGPAIGAIDIGESVDEYFFRVSLPGVVKDEKSFTYVIHPDGEVIIRGVTSTGEKTVWKNSMAFEMHTQNLSPPGEFSISFWLPGPVFHQQLITTFGSDGIFEGLVKKRPQMGR